MYKKNYPPAIVEHRYQNDCDDYMMTALQLKHRFHIFDAVFCEVYTARRKNFLNSVEYMKPGGVIYYIVARHESGSTYGYKRIKQSCSLHYIYPADLKIVCDKIARALFLLGSY